MRRDAQPPELARRGAGVRGEPAQLPELAALLHRLPFSGGIDMLRRQRHYEAAAMARGIELPEGSRRWHRHLREIQGAFAAHPDRHDYREHRPPYDSPRPVRGRY